MNKELILNRNILFITHDTSIYGASQSLQLITKNFNENFYLGIQKPLFKSKINLSDISKKFGIKEENIILLNLPYNLSIIHPKETLKRKLSRLIYNLRFLFTKESHKNIFSKFDLIHLNSLVLSPLIDSKNSFTIHAREFFIEKKFFLFNSKKNFECLKGVIFIDQSTKDSLQNYSIKKSTIITNPINMLPLIEKWDKNSAAKALGIEIENKTIFSIIGRVDLDEDKGVGFLIKTIKEIDSKDIKVLIFGSVDSKTYKQCIKLINNDDRIILMNEIKDQGLIYSVSDIILRGESFFRVGRTHLEGLYAGCKIIIPGSKEEVNQDKGLKHFKSQILTYIPRNEKSLKACILSCINDKKSSPYEGNYKESVFLVKSFFKEIIG